jgi:hypothetical protein
MIPPHPIYYPIPPIIRLHLQQQATTHRRLFQHQQNTATTISVPTAFGHYNQQLEKTGDNRRRTVKTVTTFQLAGAVW